MPEASTGSIAALKTPTAPGPGQFADVERRLAYGVEHCVVALDSTRKRTSFEGQARGSPLGASTHRRHATRQRDPRAAADCTPLLHRRKRAVSPHPTRPRQRRATRSPRRGTGSRPPTPRRAPVRAPGHKQNRAPWPIPRSRPSTPSTSRSPGRRVECPRRFQPRCSGCGQDHHNHHPDQPRRGSQRRPRQRPAAPTDVATANAQCPWIARRLPPRSSPGAWPRPRVAESANAATP